MMVWMVVLKMRPSDFESEIIESPTSGMFSWSADETVSKSDRTEIATTYEVESHFVPVFQSHPLQPVKIWRDRSPDLEPKLVNLVVETAVSTAEN